MAKMNRRSFLLGGVASAAAITGVANKAMAQASFTPSAVRLNSIRSSFLTTDPARFVHPRASASTAPVGVKLACNLDASSSVDTVEYGVQLRAAAAALRSQDFRDAIFHPLGPGSIAICFVDFGSFVDIAVPWIDIRQGDEAKLDQLADEVERMGRRESGSTYQIKALFYNMLAMEYCPWEADRGIVDFMTDGKDNDNALTPKLAFLHYAREQLARVHNTTINTLITVDPASGNADLEQWANANLVTPPGITGPTGQPVVPGFNKIVAYEQTEESERAIARFEGQMVRAFKEKLIREVAGANFGRMFPQYESSTPSPR